jgi:hypothetical protein
MSKAQLGLQLVALKWEQLKAPCLDFELSPMRWEEEWADVTAGSLETMKAKVLA